jgi:hypothetical protein
MWFLVLPKPAVQQIFSKNKLVYKEMSEKRRKASRLVENDDISCAGNSCMSVPNATTLGECLR